MRIPPPRRQCRSSETEDLPRSFRSGQAAVKPPLTRKRTASPQGIAITLKYWTLRLPASVPSVVRAKKRKGESAEARRPGRVDVRKKVAEEPHQSDCRQPGRQQEAPGEAPTSGAYRSVKHRGATFHLAAVYLRRQMHRAPAVPAGNLHTDVLSNAGSQPRNSCQRSQSTGRRRASPFSNDDPGRVVSFVASLLVPE